MNELTEKIITHHPELGARFTASGVEVRRRGEYRWAHAWLHLLDLVWPAHRDRFSIAQGSTIYLSSGAAKTLGSRNTLAILRHEYQHVLQWSLWFAISYVLSRRWRVLWEIEGYAQNLLVYHEAGRMTDRIVDSVADLIADNYVLMTEGMRDFARESIRDIAARIRQGDISGYDTTTLREDYR